MEFLGMEVEGSGGPGEESDRPEQYTIDHFKSTVAAILIYPEVTGIAWTQYTPYFNDGEPCVFRAGEPYFCFEGVELSDEEEAYYDYSWMEEDFEENKRVWCGDYCNSEIFDRIVGNTEKEYGPWNGNYRTRTWSWKEGSGPDSAPNPHLFNAVTTFTKFLNAGNYDHAVEDLFGDHAIIRIDKLAGKVIIDEYSHD